MKVFDCFTFYNEFDLLEIRLEEMWDKVDHFVISEANTTHAGSPKDFLLLDNWERFKPYADKIIHLRIEDMPGVIDNNFWHNEKHQRNCLVRGLTSATENDIVMIGDIDEIIRPSSIEQIRNDQQHSLWGFRAPCFNFKLNYMWIYVQPYQVYAMAVKVKRLVSSFQSLDQARVQHGGQWPNRPLEYDDGHDLAIQHGGWHFSSLGDTDHVKNKYRQYAHNEKQETIEAIDVEKYIAENKTSIGSDHIFQPVVLDEYFPKTILNNKEKYKKFILEGDFETVFDKYKSLPNYFNNGYYNSIPLHV
jgi:beta-1,4-mannosyl-glycoprotein beta-1,4-N-acetylglucosaminyltransferase